MEIADIYTDLPVLETERLILRKLRLEDLEDMYSYASDEELTKYVTWDTHQSMSDTEQFMNYVLQQYANKSVAPWAIEYKQNGKMIGTIDFVWWKPDHKIAEIGYVLSKDYWGKGMTTEAARAIIQFGFEQMDLVCIQARCFIQNIGSSRVMEKSGMSFEGIIRKAMFLKGAHQDLRMYSILREEFKR
ncbi:GNAT family protein [Paenibacillus sediminis]|uniref:Ribosomal-protein-alanine N-acetyltransferase n=1 Tax=Paenibacillus sediminis TaxID=664909 RepID=A0ABS4H2X0_9BACL|nr:GNAT family protein [Paenibacillus sediminis]MBP1936887.1 ribosomal-protein-alanine N-acetyltransferase [Paenibacillus sediminis]